MANNSKYITRTVWILSFVSLLTDMASEMLYPVMPLYLRTIGFSVLIIGVLEGFAEATAGLSKGFFGKWSDSSGKRLPFVRLGYSLSALSKPMMVLFINPFWVFFSRTLDRLGKGIRTGARDALLSDQATNETKARVFGFHRSMDTLGAVIGPLIALLFLYFFPGQYYWLFILALIPGVFSILSTFLLKEQPKPLKEERSSMKSAFTFIKYWKESPAIYKRIVTGFLLFALINSSDVFLLLKVKEAGFNDYTVIALYIFFNMMYTVFAYPIGIAADKLGLKHMFIFGIFIFAMVYAGFSFVGELYQFVILFSFYGLFMAATEGISKAWISNSVEQKDLATAIGTYTGFQSVFSFVSSSVAGLIWFGFGSTVLFISTGIAAMLVMIYFLTLKNRSN